MALVLHAFPGVVATREGSLAYPAVGARQQRPALGDGQPLRSAGGPHHVELHAPGERVVKTPPGVQTVDAKIGGQTLLGEGHRLLGILPQAPEHGIRIGMDLEVVRAVVDLTAAVRAYVMPPWSVVINMPSLRRP